jgi:anti-anti-sigma regulatory factor/HAMP domain-containing protein
MFGAMIPRMTIRAKILTILATVAIVSTGVTAFVGYRTARRALEQEAFLRLTAVREMKAQQVENYFQQITDQIVTYSEDRMITQAAVAFRQAAARVRSDLGIGTTRQATIDAELRLQYQQEFFPRLAANSDDPPVLNAFWPRDAGGRVLQHLYIAGNDFETGSKHLLDQADDGSSYSSVHRTYHPIIRDFLERFGYYDIFLVDHVTGQIVYSVFKEVDFGTSLLTGPYSETNIGRAFRAARDTGTPTFTRLIDFEPYAPSYNGQASFIASPIVDGDQMVGVLVFQMPVSRINDIMTSGENWERVGLGESGETYIVGSDNLLRNQSRFLIEDRDEYLRLVEAQGTPAATVRAIDNLNSAIGLQAVRTEGTDAALAGETGTRIFPDYRGVPVLSAYRPLAIRDVQWVIMSEIDAAEAFGPATALRNRTVVLMLILIAAIVAVAIVFARTLTYPVLRLSRSAAALADGRLDTPVVVAGRDEIADLARSFESMRQSLQALIRRQESAIDALSTPLIPLQDDVVVMPLVGELDARRVHRIREELVDGLHARGARVAIIDLTAIPSIAPEVAGGLLRAAQAARLVGARVVFTGVQADTAKQLVEIGMEWQGIDTARSLQDGFARAMQYLGRTS